MLLLTTTAKEMTTLTKKVRRHMSLSDKFKNNRKRTGIKIQFPPALFVRSNNLK